MPGAGAPSAWVRRWIGPPGQNARLLDLACGAGRHARFAAGLNYDVLAVDRDPRIVQALCDCKKVETRVEDLESGRWSFSAERFAAVIVTHYLHRPRLDLLPSLLLPAGQLVIETFACGQAAHGKPSNPDFLLRPGELLRLAARAGLAVIAFEDAVYVGAVAHSSTLAPSQPLAAAPRRRLQRIVAVRPPFDRESSPVTG